MIIIKEEIITDLIPRPLQAGLNLEPYALEMFPSARGVISQCLRKQERIDIQPAKYAMEPNLISRKCGCLYLEIRTKRNQVAIKFNRKYSVQIFIICTGEAIARYCTGRRACKVRGCSSKIGANWSRTELSGT